MKVLHFKDVKSVDYTSEIWLIVASRFEASSGERNRSRVKILKDTVIQRTPER